MNDYRDMSPLKGVEKKRSSQNIMKFYNERSLDNRMNAMSEKDSVKPLESRDSSFIGLFFDDKLKSLKKQEEKAMYEDDFDQLKKVRSVMKSISKAK